MSLTYHIVCFFSQEKWSEKSDIRDILDSIFVNLRIYSKVFIKHTILKVSELTKDSAYPVDTGRKLNVHKTFNLRPVSTGYD